LRTPLHTALTSTDWSSAAQKEPSKARMRALLTVAIFENFTVHYQLPLIYCNINSIIGTEGGPVISSAKNETTQAIQNDYSTFSKLSV